MIRLTTILFLSVFSMACSTRSESDEDKKIRGDLYKESSVKDYKDYLKTGYTSSNFRGIDCHGSDERFDYFAYQRSSGDDILFKVKKGEVKKQGGQ